MNAKQSYVYKDKFTCPKKCAVGLVCDIKYCTEQFQRSMQGLLDSSKQHFITFSDDSPLCMNTAELCSRYMEYIAKAEPELFKLITKSR